MEDCWRQTAEYANLTDQHKSTTCPPSWDRSLCWPATSGGERLSIMCPLPWCQAHLCNVPEKDRFAYRDCVTLNDSSPRWVAPNYDACRVIFHNHSECVDSFCSACPDPMKEAVVKITIGLCITSILLLTISLIIFNIFRSIQNRRLTIHKHFVLAFILRSIFVALWTVSQTDKYFYKCPGVKHFQSHLEWLCKSLLWFFIYVHLACVFWMCVEGCYLASRFTVFAMRIEGSFFPFLIAGWGLPFLVTLTWSLMYEFFGQAVKDECWISFMQSPYQWILIVPMGSALILNFLLLVLILAILVRKLYAENVAESKKMWKTVKATLLLVPLLGVANILLFAEPSSDNPTTQNVYQLLSTVLQQAQGIFLAILYCFLNGEVQGAFSRYLTSWPCYQKFRNRSSTTNLSMSTRLGPKPNTNNVDVKANNMDDSETMPLRPKLNKTRNELGYDQPRSISQITM